ncbi:MAG: GatB/YqeY domain-containing protein [Patescibacteria group bacterium]|nr:GatB/YqeY domain-containing protein [Patescibacteria group bacterium]
MPNLSEKINGDLKMAMQEKNEIAVSVLRMLISAIRNKEISLRKGEEIKLADEQIIEVVKSEIKKRKDSVEAYKAGGRQDLADKEKKEEEILELYMPPQISDEELEKIVKETINSLEEASENDFGKIMGQVMARVKGQADGNKASEAVKKVLAESKK